MYFVHKNTAFNLLHHVNMELAHQFISRTNRIVKLGSNV